MTQGPEGPPCQSRYVSYDYCLKRARLQPPCVTFLRHLRGAELRNFAGAPDGASGRVQASSPFDLSSQGGKPA